MTVTVEHDTCAHLPYAAFDIVVMAASSGGLRAYTEIFQTIPNDFSAAIVLVQHRDARQPELFTRLMETRCRLPIQPVRDGEQVQAGTVYITPPDKQVLITADRRFTFAQPAGGFTDRSRCQADPLFESVAETYGERAIAVVLTGHLSDGATGVRLIKRMGGRVLAQDQATSQHFSMPSASIATGCIDFVLPLNRIADALVTFVMKPGAAQLFRVPIASWARVTMSA